MAVNDIAVQEFVNAIKEPPQDTNNTYNATVSRIDDEGVVWVYLQGSEIETPTASTSSEVEAGDSVTVQWRNNKLYIEGNYSNPSAGTTTVMPSVNFVSELLNKDISADSVSAATGYIGELTAEHITADDIQAGTGYIKELRADNITAEDISASSGYIKELKADNIEAEDIVADHADIGDLKANKADIDLLNVDVAWIEQGNIKKAEVFDENVFDLSGNRATLSRIDASKINVANLRADNLIVRRINGQPVVGGYTLIDSNSPGYSSKNPQALGWYEFVNAQWVLSTDTTVDMTKAYYQEGNEVSLYDQAYIDALGNDLQQQIDGAVETYTGTVVPTLVNQPYTDWYDTSVTPIHDERAKHVGDIYYVVNSAASENGYCYRFAYDNTTHAYSWVLIKDSDVTKALSDISKLKTFESNTTSWMDETDEGLETIRTNHTALSGVVDKTVKESVQLWFTKANTTAPAKPTAEVTSTSTSGNAWRKVVPAWNASYPNYYYCWQYKFVDGTFGWSDVVRDIAMGETQGTARDAKNTADAALPASTFTSFESTTFKNVKDTVDEQTTKFTNMTTRLGLNSDGTGANTDIVAKESALEQTVDGISTRVSKTETKLAGMYATSSTAAGTAAKVATIVPALSNYELAKGAMVTVKFTAANTAASPTLNLNGTGAKAIKMYSGGDLTADEYKWKAGSTFTFTYNGTNWLMQDSTASVRMNSAESRINQTATSIESVVANNDTYTAPDGTTKTNTIKSAIKQNADNIELKVSKDGVIASINASVEESGGSALKISADKVNIEGAAIFTGSGRLSTTSLNNTYDANGAATNALESAKGYVDGKGYQTATDVSSAVATGVSGKADKSDAVARQQRIYYRKTSSGAPSKNTTWLSTSGTGYGNWSLKIPQMTSGTTKYPYLYTAVQTQTVSQKAAGNTCTCSDVLLDDTTTVIDGGTIITGTVNANAVDATSGTFNTANIPNLNASKITAGDISADRMKVNSINAINSLTSGQINGARINAGQITVSSLSDGSNYSTTTQMNTAIGDAVDGIEVGGRNLAVKAAGEDWRTKTIADGTNETINLFGSLNVSDYINIPEITDVKVGDLIQVSFDIKFSSNWAATGTGTKRCYVQGSHNVPISWSAIDYTNGGGNKEAELEAIMASTSKEGHLSTYFKVADKMLNGTTTGVAYTNIRFDYYSGDVSVRHVMVEKATKPSNWSPAPEDVQAEIDAKKSVHTLNTAYSYSYANLLTYSAEGYNGDAWTVSSTSGVKVGDTVRLKCIVSNMSNTPVYVVGTVTEVVSGTSLKMTSHGLDTTIIDGGNILTNSITANQLNVTNINASKKLTVGAMTDATKESILNSEIEIGGKNLLRHTDSPTTNDLARSRSTVENGGIIRVTPTTVAAYTKFKVDYLDYANFAGKTLTASADVRLAPVTSEYTDSTGRLYVGVNSISRLNNVLSSSYDRYTYKAFNLTTDWQRVSFSVQIPDEFNYGTTDALVTGNQIVVQVGGAASTKPSEWRHIKLEIGNKATDWTPAQEDYITDIDGTGIRIHPASTENNSVVIDADGVYILKGGTDKTTNSVAFYGDSARIGKESGSHLTLAPDSMSMSDGTKDVFNLLQKTMYIRWNRNYKGRQFANSTDRYVDSWETNTTISTWDSITVNYKLNNTSRTKKITSISNGVLANDEIYVHFNYSGTIITLTYGRGSSAASSDIIKLGSAVVYYVTDEKLSQLHTGTYPNTTVSGALRIGNGTSDSNRRNLMLVDWSGTGKFKGDILAFCGADSSGGMSLTKAEENIDAFKYEDANGLVYIDAYRVGRIVSLLCSVRKTTSIAPGANLYQLDLTNAHLPKPLGTNTSGTGIVGKNMIIGNVYYNKTVTPNRYEFICRNGGSTAVQMGSTSGVGFTITYICQMDEVSGEIKYMDD